MQLLSSTIPHRRYNLTDHLLSHFRQPTLYSVSLNAEVSIHFYPPSQEPIAYLIHLQPMSLQKLNWHELAKTNTVLYIYIQGWHFKVQYWFLFIHWQNLTADLVHLKLCFMVISTHPRAKPDNRPCTSKTDVLRWFLLIYWQNLTANLAHVRLMFYGDCYSSTGKTWQLNLYT